MRARFETREVLAERPEVDRQLVVLVSRTCGFDHPIVKRGNRAAFAGDLPVSVVTQCDKTGDLLSSVAGKRSPRTARRTVRYCRLIHITLSANETWRVLQMPLILAVIHIGLLIVITTCIGVSDSDAQPNMLPDAEKQDGWRLLFDGRSADQWRGYQKTGMEGL